MVSNDLDILYWRYLKRKTAMEGEVMKDGISDLEKDLLTNEPAELNSGGDQSLLESYINQKRPKFAGGYFGAVRNLNEVELPDSPIPTEIAMDEHFFPEE